MCLSLSRDVSDGIAVYCCLQVRCQSCPKEMALEHLLKHERSECEHRNQEAIQAQEEAEAARLREREEEVEAANRAERSAALLHGVGADEVEDGAEDDEEGAEFYASGARQVAENNLAAELLAEGVSLEEVAEILQALCTLHCTLFTTHCTL